MRGHNICRLFQPLPSTLLVFPSLWFLFLTILCIWFLQITFYFLLSYFLTHPIKKILIVILDKYSKQGRVNGLWENVNTFNTTIGIMQRKNHNRSKDDTLLPKDILMAIPAEHILFLEQWQITFWTFLKITLTQKLFITLLPHPSKLTYSWRHIRFFMRYSFFWLSAGLKKTNETASDDQKLVSPGMNQSIS